MNPKLLVLLCLTTILLTISPSVATYDVVSGIASNSTEYTTTASYTELHNISLATGTGSVFIKASWDARMNFTAPLYGRFLRDGVSLGRFNLTQSVYAQVGSYELSLNETTGTHYYGWEVYSNKRGTIYSRNFSAVFLKNGTYGTTLTEVNSSAQITRTQVTGQEGVDTTQNTSISNLQVNDTYFNGTIFPNSTNFRNDSISGKLDISTYSGNYPNSSLINYLLITTYGGNFPNNSLSNYLLTSLFGSNFNTSFHAEIPVCNATIGKLVSDDGESVTCGTDQTGAVSSVTAQSPLTYTGTTDVVIKDERTTYPNDTISGNLVNWNSTFNATYDAKMSNPATADLNMNNYSISTAKNVSAKNIGGVIYADQYATLQDAINQTSTSGGIVQLPIGTVNITKQLFLFNGTTLRGYGKGVSILRVPDNTIFSRPTNDGWCWKGQPQNLLDNYALILNCDYAGYDHLGNSNISIHDFTLDWNSQNQVIPAWAGGIYGLGISLRWADGSEIYNMEILNSPFGAIDLSGAGNTYNTPTSWSSTRMQIHHNTIKNSGNNTQGTGILGTYYFSNSNIHDNIIQNATYGIEIEDNSYLNNIHDNNIDGSALAALYDITSVANIWSDNSINNSHSGLDSLNSAETKVSGNLIKNVNYGINVSIQRGSISNNDIYYAQNKGIYVISKNQNSILNNKLHNINGEAINLTSSQRNILKNNDIMDDRVGASQTFGINESGTSDFNIIQSNSFENVLSTVWIVGSNSARISNWQVNNAGVLSGDTGYNHGNSATAPTAFGAGDPFFNTTAGIQQLYTGSAWDWFLMPSKVFGTGVTNNNNGSITIVDSTYNATYAIGGGAISFSNGTNNIATGTKKKKRMATAGTITALYVNQTNDDACSGNITVSSSGTNKAYIAWSSVANASSTGLTATFNQGEWLMYNMTENTGCKDFTFEQAHTKS